MRIATSLLAVTMLAACSQQPEQQAASPLADASTTPRSVASAPSASTTSSAPVAATSGGSALVGRVSPLVSGISGLNIRVTDMGTIIDLPSDALFDFDKSTLTPGAAEQLEKSAQVIRAAPAGEIRIVGHTDSKGDDAYNQKLSEARAHTVADWFSQQVGVRQRRFDISGMGEKASIAPDQTADGKDNPTGRARNRRVEVILPNRP